MSTPIAAADPLRGVESNAADHAGAGVATWREIIALLRLATFLRVDGADITGRELTIALLGLMTLTVWIVVDPLVHSRDLVFTWFALPDLACVVAGVFGLAWLLARLSQPALAYRRALVLTLGAVPIAMAGTIASWKLANPALSLLTGALAIYALLYLARGLRVTTGSHRPLALIVGAASTAAFLFAMDFVQANPRLWIRADESLDRVHTMGSAWARMSRVQFAQQARIDADVAKLAAQSPSATDVFFIGFAGYGQERIFAREIDLAANVVGARYQSGQRSLRLVNDQVDLDAWPIASKPGLRHALLELRQKMGEEDVLFLALSSHGDRGAGIRVSNPGMAPDKLSAQALADMLREADIRWRIIVVSACYAGSFVDELADERSIVIAAAAPDRKSFGCNDSRQLTYFGEAFYRDALGAAPGAAPSLRVAFENARTALAQKERSAGIMPSMPRASFGALIEAKLEAERDSGHLR